VWTDLTVPDAAAIRDFYAAVAGWQPEPVSMGDYADYNMKAPGGEAAAGICHARGTNAGMPPRWMIDITVESLERSVAECEGRGGKVLVGPRPLGGKPFCVIQDPAGAVAALIEA
jgi:predicted enzyme related to lactoylglutathione lyase